MEDSLKEMLDWANSMKSQLTDYKTFIHKNMGDIPKEHMDGINEALDGLDQNEIQSVVDDAANNIINHLKSKM